MGVKALKALTDTAYVQSILEKMPMQRMIDLDGANDATAFEANQIIYDIARQTPIEDRYVAVKKVVLSAGCDDHALCGVSVAITILFKDIKDKPGVGGRCTLTESQKFKYSSNNLAGLLLKINGMNNNGDVVVDCGAFHPDAAQIERMLQSLRNFFPAGRGI